MENIPPGDQPDSDQKDLVVNDGRIAELLDRLRRLGSKLDKRTVYASIIVLAVLVIGGTAMIAWRIRQLGQGVNQGAPSFSRSELPPHDFFSGFSKMVSGIIPSHDSYSLVAEKADSLGVANDSAYILKSKEALQSDEIRSRLKLEPAVSYALEKLSDTEWRINLQDTLLPNALLKATLAGQDEKDDYTWAYQVKDRFKVLHTVPRDTGTDVPVNSGIEITFSHDNFTGYADYFAITPAVPGGFEVHGRTLVFVPTDPLNPKTVYDVTIKKGLPLIDSQEKLGEDLSFSFETADSSDISSGNELRVFEKTLEFTTDYPPILQVNSDLKEEGIRAELFKFDSWSDYIDTLGQRDKFPRWSASWDDFLVDVSRLHKVGSFDLSVKTSGHSSYLEFPETLEKGFYLTQLTQGDSKSQVWIQVSNLTAYYNVTKTDTLVWVNNARTKQPADGVKIELVGSGKEFSTNGDGLAVFKTPEEMIGDSETEDKSDDQYLKIAKDDNILVVPASQAVQNYWWQKPDEADSYWRYLYTDRPMYQTTDTIHYWGLLKPRGSDKADEATITLYKEGYVDYYYQPVSIVEQKVPLSDLQTFEGEIKLSNLRPDYYTLEMKVGDQVIERKYISVKSYTKPAFSLALTPDRKVAFAGENIGLKIKASFFDGTPVPGMKLILDTPQGDRSFTTDQNGESDLEYTEEYTECTGKYSCWPDYINLSVKPENSELAEINATASVRFYGPRIYAETKTQYPEKGMAEVELQAKMIDLSRINESYWYRSNLGDSIAPHAKIEGKVIRITHQKEETGTQYDFISKTSYKTYRYNTNEDELRSFSGTTDDKGIFRLRQAVDPGISYRVEYYVFDQDGRKERYNEYLYYYDGKTLNRYSVWDYDYYHLELNQANFALGDEVRADFKKSDEMMPEGKRRYVFMQLQNGLQEYAISDKPEYRFQFESQDIPDVNLFAVHFNGVSYDTVSDSYSSQQVTYRNKDRNLDIKVVPDKETYRPGEDVNLSIQLEDVRHKPVAAEVNLNLVDEAYYSLMEDIANPLDTIYAGVGSGSLFSQKTHYNPLQSSESAEKGGCFAAGTPVKMADGSEKAIEDVRKGDKVLTFADPISRQLVEGEVSETWKHAVAEYVVINDELKVTPEHQMFSNGRFIDAGLLKEGDWLLDSEGKKRVVLSITFEHEIISVYNLRVDPEHTFFAGGVYVHNEEKGGGPREFFTDAALFRVVKTDASGKARVSFKLPDNITSWRVTSQAISRDLGAGVNVTKLPVTLPVFADLTVGKEYLTADKPVVRMRAYGTALNSDDDVKFSVEAKSLGVDRSEPITTKAFVPAYYALPGLTQGKHELVYDLETAKGSDAIKLPFDVLVSRLEAQTARYQKLNTGTKVEAINDLPMAVVLSDEGQNQLYGHLQSLSWSRGDRVDQTYVAKYARSMLHNFYQEEITDPEFQPSEYQTESGGITLLPYSSEDLELSARAASLGLEGFDRESLAQYFFRKLDDGGSLQEEISWSLYGLAELKKPVLMRIDSWLKNGNLSAQEKLYLAQALFDLGDQQRSRQLYQEVIADYGWKKDPYVMIRTSDEPDDMFKSTAIAAVLAASLEEPEADGLFGYLVDNQVLYGYYKNSENLFNLEEANFIGHRLAQLKPSPSDVVYEFDGVRKEVKLTGTAHTFQISPESAKNLKFITVSGDVGISVRYTEPIDLGSVKRDRDILIDRKYFIDGQEKDQFSENDLIEVRLYPQFNKDSLVGKYQITDILPSGLAPVTKLYYGNNENDCRHWYPYSSSGQMTKFIISQNWNSQYNCNSKYIAYYARVKNRGTYRAEPAIIQSLVNPDFINFSNSRTVTVGE